MDDTTTTKSHPDEEVAGSEYANVTNFQPTVWDLKIIFGELTANHHGVDWHTAITLPWAQAKLMSYFLQINIAAQEASEGKIKIPERMIPALPPQPQGGENDTVEQKIFQVIAEHHKRFMESI